MRVGIDLVSIADVSASIAQFDRGYLDRIFTPREQQDCTGEAEQFASRLAARFAAKEAAIKVLCPGDQGLGWTSIEVQRAPDGWPELVLHGAAGALALQHGLTSFAVSLSHEGAYATAVVVAH
ncbi:MAG: holo-[acyl-carrier-protein] synthase [Chloroflexota bacterium]